MSIRLVRIPTPIDPAPSEGDKPAQSHGASPSEADQQVNNAKVKKAVHMLDILRIAPSEPETFVLQRTVDEAAPDLAKALDPENGLGRRPTAGGTLYPNS